MPLYDFECSNPQCLEEDEPHGFEAFKKITEDDAPSCPKCDKDDHVKKVIKTAVPKSGTWRAH